MIGIGQVRYMTNRNSKLFCKKKDNKGCSIIFLKINILELQTQKS